MAIKWGILRKEIAAVRAGMYVLNLVLEASKVGGEVDVPLLGREAHRMMTHNHEHGSLSSTELEKIKMICADDGRFLCPYCGCPHTGGDDPQILEDGILQNMQCTRCEETWDNHYILIERFKGF
ncbi:hypothetical protein LCGC14_0276160 [marine sediment metagenome]|uniref:Uncharacterized protein n=1 Tax=marine sediment metagenome TaxID=412755 RepID=A0A0F9U2P4_9ZZZZ